MDVIDQIKKSLLPVNLLMTSRKEQDILEGLQGGSVFLVGGEGVLDPVLSKLLH